MIHGSKRQATVERKPIKFSTVVTCACGERMWPQKNMHWGCGGGLRKGCGNQVHNDDVEKAKS